jgi:prepilin-type N-terminal cleavage/methylation domain-containing protein
MLCGGLLIKTYERIATAMHLPCRAKEGYGMPRSSGQGGFTLIEIIAVLVILGFLSIVAVPQYMNLTDQAERQGANMLIATAQSQLSLEFSRRALAGASLETTTQSACDTVAVSSTNAATSIVCTGNFSGNVTITATYGGQTATGTWVCPVSSGS